MLDSRVLARHPRESGPKQAPGKLLLMTENKSLLLKRSASVPIKTLPLVAFVLLALIYSLHCASGTVLVRVCDTREIKAVTNRVCMLYKRTKNSDIKLDKQGNLRISRDVKGSDYSPAKLASDCCKIGCPPHIFAYNCD